MNPSFSIIYVDNHLLVVSKLPGFPTQPTPGEKTGRNITDEAKEWIKHTYQKPGRVFLEPIHRLDRPVSGLVLFARTSKALSRLQAMMRERRIEKKYYALVATSPPSESGVFEDYLIHDAYRARVVPSSYPQGKQAVLEYRIVKEYFHSKSAFLLEIRLVTGRYHQIRVQLASRGLPILGDEKYQSAHRWRGEGIALHQGKMEFIHPVTQEVLSFNAPLPDTFYKVL